MTKNQKLRADVNSGRTKYLHISVLVGGGKRTPKGHGATARKIKNVPRS